MRTLIVERRSRFAIGSMARRSMVPKPRPVKKKAPMSTSEHRAEDEERAAQELHREQMLRIERGDALGHAALQELAKDGGIEARIAVAELHRGEQILAQLGRGFLHQAGQPARPGHVQEQAQAGAPFRHQHGGVGDAAQHPAQPVGHLEEPVEQRHRHHGGEEHGERGADSAQDDQAPPPHGEGLELLQDERIHGRERQGAEAREAGNHSIPARLRRNHSTVSRRTTGTNHQ